MGKRDPPRCVRIRRSSRSRQCYAATIAIVIARDVEDAEMATDANLSPDYLDPVSRSESFAGAPIAQGCETPLRLVRIEFSLRDYGEIRQILLPTRAFASRNTSANSLAQNNNTKMHGGIMYIDNFYYILIHFITRNACFYKFVMHTQTIFIENFHFTSKRYDTPTSFYQLDEC